MSLPPGFLDDLRSRVSLAQVVGRKVVWDSRKSNPAKGDHWAPCPFHAEKTASFHVDDRKGYYYCFGCHAKGDALAFLRETENLGFLEAVEMLAREAGLTLPAPDPAARARETRAAGLVDAMEAAVRFYRAQANGARAAEARAYLDRRGLSPATRERFEIGFAGAERDALYAHLTAKGIAPPLLAEAGLCVLPEDGGAPYDRFRERIIFPIRDARGRAIAFGGRTLSGSARAKYLNSPETPLFDKGRTLFNIGPAREAAGKAGALIVVEGYMDVIALTQVGIAHAVAPLGTAITEDQLRLLWRIADEPVIALDGDAAGQGAAARLVDLALPLLAAGKGLRFARLPPEQDPDIVVREGGAPAMERLIAASRPMIDLLWDRETDGAPLDSPERRAAFDARLRAHLGRISDPSLRAHYHAELRARRGAVIAPARPARLPRPVGAPGFAPGGRRDTRAGQAVHPGPALPATRASLLGGAADGEAAQARIRESAILAGCLNHPALAAACEDRLERMRFLCSDLGEIRDALLSALTEPLHAADAAALQGAVAARLGRDPMPEITAPGQVRANPHLRAGAEAAQAALAIEEELARHAALQGRRAEVRDAVEEMLGAADEGLTWRLKQAAEAAHRATAQPLADTGALAEAETRMSVELQGLIDKQIWKKPPRR